MRYTSLKLAAFCALAVLAGTSPVLGQSLTVEPLPNNNLKNLKVLLLDSRYTNGSDGGHGEAAKTAHGYWVEFGQKYGFLVFESKAASDLNASNLKNFNLVVINYTNAMNDYLTTDQQKAFQAYIEGGGNVIGYHTAAKPRDGEWDWYRENIIIGLYNPNYHGLQPGKTVKTKDPEVLDLETSKRFLAGMPESFQTSDEWYAFNQGSTFNNHAKVLYYVDEASMKNHTHSNLTAEQMALPIEKRHPLVWYLEDPVSKGRRFYAGLIHNPTGARSDFFKLLLLRAAEFAAGFPDSTPIANAKMLKAFPEKMRVLAEPDRMLVGIEYAGDYEIALHDIKGKSVLRTPFRGKSLVLERQGRPRGNYFLRLSSGGKTLVTRTVNWQ